MKKKNQFLKQEATPTEDKAVARNNKRQTETHICVCSLYFSDGEVKCSPGCKSLCQALTDPRQLATENLDVMLQSLLFLFI